MRVPRVHMLLLAPTGHTHTGPGGGKHLPRPWLLNPPLQQKEPGPWGSSAFWARSVLRCRGRGSGQDEVCEKDTGSAMTRPPTAGAGEIWATLQPGLRELLPPIVARICPTVPCGQAVVGGGRVTMAARLPWPPAALCQAAPQGPGAGRWSAGSLWLHSRCLGPGLGPSHRAQENVPCATDTSAKSEEPQPHQASQWRGPSMGTVVLEGGE